ncbi:YlbF family regulator [Acholeplasma sp. OttesenSCG-928-E16]|nr:YlbF family regulator [Acholeplasma sp. OttesenSCG-928-E16]
MNELLKQANKVALEIKESIEYIEYKKLEKTILSKYKNEITEFNKTNNEYNEVLKYGDHHPDLKIKRDAFIKAKEKLYLMSEVKRYKELENFIQRELDSISREIGSIVSEEIITPNEIGFNVKVKKHG